MKNDLIKEEISPKRYKTLIVLMTILGMIFASIILVICKKVMLNFFPKEVEIVRRYGCIYIGMATICLKSNKMVGSVELTGINTLKKNLYANVIVLLVVLIVISTLVPNPEIIARLDLEAIGIIALMVFLGRFHKVISGNVEVFLIIAACMMGIAVTLHLVSSIWRYILSLTTVLILTEIGLKKVKEEKYPCGYRAMEYAYYFICVILIYILLIIKS